MLRLNHWVESPLSARPRSRRQSPPSIGEAPRDQGGDDRRRPAVVGLVWFDVRVNVYDLAGRLSGIAELRDRCRGLAMIEAIVCPQWAFRYYSFDAAWLPGEEMASMRNGSGDAYSIVFAPHGVFVRGLDHKSPMSPFASGGLWPGLVDSIPEVFSPQVIAALQHDIEAIGYPGAPTSDGTVEG